MLSWYHKPTDKKARGELDLTASGASLASNFTAGMLGKPPTRHVFAITTKKRVLKLAFDTEDMRNRWFEALGEYHGTVDTSRTCLGVPDLPLMLDPVERRAAHDACVGHHRLP